MWPYPWTHVGTPSNLGHMDRVAATMPSQAHAGAAQEAPDIGQWERQDVPLVRHSSWNVKEGIPSSRRYLPTYLSSLLRTRLTRAPVSTRTSKIRPSPALLTPRTLRCSWRCLPTWRIACSSRIAGFSRIAVVQLGRQYCVGRVSSPAVASSTTSALRTQSRV